ncbi:MAG: hypothetical protein KatS3mg081_2908 [Gemmatimonadales bacterium]|nr:MAG: hypothetical protein KatS3mg081_2908 [Gemmatimonadales bacterium]
MAFSVREFRELIRLLGKEPERRAELLGVLLGEDMLALPQALRELAQAQTRTEQRLEALTARVDALAARMDELTARVDALAARVDELAQAQTRTEQRLEALTARVDALAARMDELTARVDALAARMDELTARVDALAARMDELTARVDALALAQVEMAREMAALARQMRWLTDRVGGLLGESTERRYRERAPAYFDDLLRGLHVPDAEELARILDEAVDAGRISRAERRELLYADVVAFGRRRDDGSDAALAVEVSATVDEDDVRRAAHRAELLSKSTAKPATAVVAGEAIKPTADELAQKMGVWRVLDGRTFSPESGAAPREQALE